MRASTTILMLFLLLVAGAVQAETQPDYTPQGLLRLFAGEPDTPLADRTLRFRYGVVDYRALDTHFMFSPALLPLSGTERDVTNVWPDPFSLTHTQIATSPRAWRTQRARNEELRRIDKLEKKAKIKVKADK